MSAIEGAEEVERGARMALVERDGSNRVDIVVVGYGFAVLPDPAELWWRASEEHHCLFSRLGAWQPGANLAQAYYAC